ncbi:HAD family phosphatase [Pseudomonas aeruginosa]|uniref:HAD-IIB family hydrolase n=1 Tax=Pseudomonas aeruginosa TaxID=287 RepID=UPI0009A298CF|nr:HAD family hydrolase [Pseudomonas aeruginosa]MDI3611680.1 HAD family hydrolase [Pseudomonas aeruginosa]MDI4012099.1 HAD family hydrolase [Pseudomonas aeruginosa]MDI4025031.1 HAD family hydrolase [Pseudomonas aeruginosa]RPQ23647.1 HAD family phosphatase [Pseudomonas aeruginosa]HBO3498546.1 HAD family phosphatase [Pseudomonas aeruginosa]
MSSLSTNEPRRLPDALCNPAELLPFAQVKLIAFDLDGTLISTPSETLGERLVGLFSLLGAPGRNTRLTLATGRTLSGVSNIISKFAGFNRVPLVLYNGSVVIEPESESIVFHVSIPALAATQVISSTTSNKNTCAFLYTIDLEAKLKNDSSPVEKVYYSGSLEGMPARDFNGMTVHPITEINISTDRIVAILIDTTKLTTQEKIETANLINTIPEISATSSGGGYIEIRPKESSKALGIKNLCKRYNISENNVLAVGDNDNDVELLSWAGISVCVKNSSPAARAASKFYSRQGAGNAAIEILEIVRRAQRLFGRTRKT